MKVHFCHGELKDFSLYGNASCVCTTENHQDHHEEESHECDLVDVDCVDTEDCCEESESFSKITSPQDFYEENIFLKDVAVTSSPLTYSFYLIEPKWGTQYEIQDFQIPPPLSKCKKYIQHCALITYG